jgi:hypothetical protein
MTQPLPNPNPILPDNPEYLPIHTRNYEVRAFKVNDNEILLWGAVRDDKPAGMYVQNDDEVLTIHHMVVQLRVSFPMMEIIDASAELKEFPHHECQVSALSTRVSLVCRLLAGSPTRFASCLVAHAVALIRLLCYRRWDQLQFNVAGACASSK